MSSQSTSVDRLPRVMRLSLACASRVEAPWPVWKTHQNLFFTCASKLIRLWVIIGSSSLEIKLCRQAERENHNPCFITTWTATTRDHHHHHFWPENNLQKNNQKKSVDHPPIKATFEDTHRVCELLYTYTSLMVSNFITLSLLCPRGQPAGGC